MSYALWAVRVASDRYCVRMPMTLAHPAAVLPLRRLGLPMSALVLGSMIPDAPLFVHWSGAYDAMHSLAGVVTIDVVATMVALAVWFAVVRDALVDLSPEVIRSRLSPRARLTPRQWRFAPVGALLGAVTHLLWDDFTHAGRWGVEHVGWLRAEHAGLVGSTWAQYGSGVIGMLIACAYVGLELRSLPRAADGRPPAALSPLVLLSVLGLAVAVGLATAAVRIGSGVQAAAFDAVINGVVIIVAGTACACIAWWVHTRKPRAH